MTLTKVDTLAIGYHETLFGIQVQLLPGGGLFLHATRTLLVADLHLGKTESFQRAGIPVPSGSTAAGLQRCDSMLRQTNARHLIFLGDLFHARTSLTDRVRAQFDAFRNRNANCSVALVAGNHDAPMLPRLRSWGLVLHEDDLTLGVGDSQVLLSHFPGESGSGHCLRLCGHVHPSIRLPSDDLPARLPCFHLDHRQQCLTLPSSGDFTGTHTIKPGTRDRVWIAADGFVFALPPFQ